jgi:hypothetical protein
MSWLRRVTNSARRNCSCVGGKVGREYNSYFRYAERFIRLCRSRDRFNRWIMNQRIW